MPLRAWLLAAVALMGCRAQGVEKYQEARSRYEALVQQGRAPGDPAFDDVLRLLEAVPVRSNVRERADQLREALLSSRQPRIPAPLVKRPERAEGEAPEIAALEVACARLAEQLGRAPTEERAAVEQRLLSCRAALEKQEEERHRKAGP